jgi:nitrate reductase NapAB chaperone NapD
MSETLVGILARVDFDSNPNLCQDLSQIVGVRTFEVGDSGKLGLLLEAESVAAAHHILRNEIEKVGGILAAWPVYSHLGEELSI